MSIHLKIPSTARAWVRGAQHVIEQQDHCDFNVMIEIEEPHRLLSGDAGVIATVDKFLRRAGKQPLDTVANTIFPDGLYRRYGALGIYDVYPQKVYPRIKTAKENRWGTYVHRMLHRENQAGKVVCPLKEVVARLRSEANNAGPKRARYELNLVDPFLDLNTSDPVLPGENYALGGPCLSHLSFKLRPDGALNLTAFYRSHYYIERALGNLIGLANLMRFVSKEAELQVGNLTCLSSYARVEVNAAWGIGDARSLLDQCSDLVADAPAQGVPTGEVP